MHEFLVVGGGIWGTALVLELIKYTDSIAWIDDGEDSASTYDARIIRAEYADTAHRVLATEALERFENDPAFSNFFHKSGWFLLRDEEQRRTGSIAGNPQGDPDNFNNFKNVFPDASVGKALHTTRSENVGWVDAGSLLRHLSETSKIPKHAGKADLIRREGVRYRVRAGSKEFLAKTVVLATGWRTNSLLELSGLSKIQYDIVGVLVLSIQLNKEQQAKYGNMPIICEPGRGEILPPNSAGIMTINNAISFLFDEPLESSQLSTSSYFQENYGFLLRYCPDLAKCPVASFRICRDALTPHQSFYFREVDGAPNLYCAGGGSFHGFKFLPVLGRLAAALLDVSDNQEARDVWKTLTREENKHADLVPKRTWQGGSHV